jgi:hypothetical protein
LAQGVLVPTERFLFVLSKKKRVASEEKPLAPFENWMAPEIPEEEPPEVRHVPPMEKQPLWRLMPFPKVEDAVVLLT